MNIINPLVAEYLNGFYTPDGAILAEIRTRAEEQYIPIITKDVERLLSVLLLSLKPEHILEIGTAIGYSAAFMARSWPDCRIDTIEINHKSYLAALENLDRLELRSRVHVYHGDATETMKQLAATHEATSFPGYDLVFIDASKSKYLSFFTQAIDLMKPGGLILCDNVLMRGTVANDCYDPEGKHKTSVKNIRAFLDHITALDTMETAILPIGDGLSMSFKK